LNPPQDWLFRLQCDLEQKHCNGIKNLHLALRKGVIEVFGQANSFYDKQLLAESLRKSSRFPISTQGVSVIKPTGLSQPVNYFPLLLLREWMVAHGKPNKMAKSDQFPGSGSNVLIAGSDDFWRSECANRLRRNGFRDCMAKNGLECLEILRKQPTEILVLSDRLLWGGIAGVVEAMDQEELHPTVCTLYCGFAGKTSDAVIHIPTLMLDVYLMPTDAVEEVVSFVRKMLSSKISGPSKRAPGDSGEDRPSKPR
jgi:hypothetical protein